jgi:carboxyl-terminal processing protease
MKIRSIFAVLLIAITVGCDKEDPTMSKLVENYLNEVIDIMQQNSINRKTINWEDFRKNVFETAGVAQTIAQTDPALRVAFRMLADNHSFIRRPDNTYINYSLITCQAKTIATPVVPTGIGYVRVTQFSGSGSDPAALTFANEIQNQIKNQDNVNIKGWIVDIRGNLGGNMYPMVAGIGPLLGEGVAGYFIDADGNTQSWGYSQGASTYDATKVTQLSTFHTLLSPDPKVAVLLDNGVASSGEIVAISFIGRPKTKSFGAPTCGLSTGNSQFALSDGSMLLLTTVYQADRNKTKYGKQILPDKTSSDDTIITDAVNWLME